MTAMAQALSVALLDFVWQGLAAAFLLWIVLYVLKDRSARARYAASCLTLAAMALMPVVTAFLAYHAPAGARGVTGLATAAAHAVRVAAAPPGAAPFGSAAWLEQWALPVWFAGVLVFSLRLVWAARRVSALRRRSRTPEAAVLALVAGLAERMKLARRVRVLVAAAADCPGVVGWLRPAVLLPAATLAGLTPQQLEAVLAHELAHIQRYDHLVNMLQTVVETLLFYHPAVWWASHRIRQERELCCDDLAVAACGDALCYARALTRLERLRLTAPGMALGSTGGPLLYRIRRILGEADRSPSPAKLPGMLALTFGLICLALNMPNLQLARGQQQEGTIAATRVVETGTPDDSGVSVDLGGASVIHRDGVEYPGPALEKGTQGTVLVEATLDATGMVTDARVLSGPQALRKAVLESVLGWRFADGAEGSTRRVSVTFQMPPEDAITRRAAEKARADVRARALTEELEAKTRAVTRAQEDLARSSEDRKRSLEESLADAKQMAASAERMQAASDLLRQRDWQRQAEELENRLRMLQDSGSDLAAGAASLAEAQRSQVADLEKRLAELRVPQHSFPDRILIAGRLRSITVQGLSDALRDELLSKLPVHVEDELTAESFEKIEEAVRQFDEHLHISLTISRNGQVDLCISAPGSGSAGEPRQ